MHLRFPTPSFSWAWSYTTVTAANHRIVPTYYPERNIPKTTPPISTVYVLGIPESFGGLGYAKLSGYVGVPLDSSRFPCAGSKFSFGSGLRTWNKIPRNTASNKYDITYCFWTTCICCGMIKVLWNGWWTTEQGYVWRTPFNNIVFGFKVVATSRPHYYSKSTSRWQIFCFKNLLSFKCPHIWEKHRCRWRVSPYCRLEAIEKISMCFEKWAEWVLRFLKCNLLSSK